MNNSSRINATRKIAVNGMMIALVFLATYVTKIPTASVHLILGFGYNNSGSSFGRKSGFLAGAIGSSVADIAMDTSICTRHICRKRL